MPKINYMLLTYKPFCDRVCEVNKKGQNKKTPLFRPLTKQ